MLTLRPYQEDALAAISRAYARGISRPLIALPTGTGKTVSFPISSGNAQAAA